VPAAAQQQQLQKVARHQQHKQQVQRHMGSCQASSLLVACVRKRASGPMRMNSVNGAWSG
jgi:hypothetical protein